MSEPFISYSQHGEDVVLWRALGTRRGIVYVDVGAFHPSLDSVTRALYERGWRGVNIEPDPELLALFERERPDDINVAVAVGDHDGTISLRRGKQPGWSTTVDGSAVDSVVDATAEPIEVPLRRIDSLLSELGVPSVDVVKIDVEGAEVAVVEGMLAGALRPAVCVVEGVSPVLGRGPGDQAVALLVEGGYQHCMFDGINHWLTLDSHLVDALSIPANPLDGFVRQPPPEEDLVVDPSSGDETRVPRVRPDEQTPLTTSLVGDLEPEQVIERLFLFVLGRPPDHDGSANWVRELAGGAGLDVIAQRLALQPEAQERPLSVRLQVATELEALRVQLVERGVASGTEDT